MEADSIETFSQRMREPLHSIIGFVKLILDGMVPSPEMQKEVLSVVYQQSERLRNIVDDLLDSNIVKPLGMENPPFSIRDVIQNAVKRERKFGDEKGITTRTKLSKDLSNIKGDSGKIERAVEILLAYTIKVSPEGSSIALSAGEEGNHILVRISSTAADIPVNVIPEMLPETAEDDRAGNKPANENSLDLYIARRYIEAHCGEIWVDNREDQGSAFCFKLPIRPCCEFTSAGDVFDSLLSDLKVDPMQFVSKSNYESPGGSDRKQALRPVNLQNNSLTVRFNEGYLLDLMAISSDIGVSPSILARQIIENAIMRYSRKDIKRNEMPLTVISPPLTTSALKPKELELLKYLVRGMSNREIAASTGLKVGTVKNHITSILRKLEASSRTHAATLAIKHHIV